MVVILAFILLALIGVAMTVTLGIFAVVALLVRFVEVRRESRRDPQKLA